jgi:hypothetical protein
MLRYAAYVAQLQETKFEYNYNRDLCIGVACSHAKNGNPKMFAKISNDTFPRSIIKL